MKNFAIDNSPERVGPGAYETKEFIGPEGQKKSMSMKFVEYGLVHSKSQPGPGQYEVDSATKRVQQKVPSYKIGTA